MKFDREVILAVSSPKEVEKFCESSLSACVMMDLHIGVLGCLIDMIHKNGKIAFLHLDLLHGITSDEYGVEYAVQNLKCDGIISTKAKAIKRAKELGVQSIFRLFLMDQRSLKKSYDLIDKLQPDFIEVLPGIVPSMISEIALKTKLPIMSGGLIKNAEQAKQAFEAGACAITTSNRDARGGKW